MTGAQVIVETLVRKGIQRLFTFPGGTLAPIYDECVKSKIEIFCAYHEQGAGYGALAAARLTGRAQVASVTSGPGATNVVTVVADAFFDSTPLVILTGQVGTADVASGRPVRQSGFQQVDTVAMMKPVTKATFLPMSPDEVAECLREAFAIAEEGRPGPVVVDLPMDVQRGSLKKPAGSLTRPLSDRPVPDNARILEAAHWIARAERPVIFAGQGVLLSGAHEALRALALARGIPVVMSILGLGAVPTDHELALGYVGHTGNQCAGLAVHHADALIVAGARLDVRQTGNRPDAWVPDGKVVHIDLDTAELDHPRVRTDLIIHSDARLAFQALTHALEPMAKKDLSAWRGRIAEWKASYPLFKGPSGDHLLPQHIIETANRITRRRDRVVVSGVGSHQQWTARHMDFDFPRQSWLTSGGHGAMGYDLPSAIGAQLTRPDDLVICFVGDGSLQINIQELQSVVSHALPIKIIVLDNKRLGIVSQFQLFNWNADPATGGRSNPDFAAVAEAYGIRAYRISHTDEVERVLQEALRQEGPALVHCRIRPEEDVEPMLMAGQTLDKMWPYHE